MTEDATWVPKLLPAWQRRDLWPVPHSGFEPLLMAAERFAAAFLGDAWTASDMGVDEAWNPPQLPQPYSRRFTYEDSSRVHAVLSKYCPEIDLPPRQTLPNALTGAPPPPPRANSYAPFSSTTSVERIGPVRQVPPYYTTNAEHVLKAHEALEAARLEHIQRYAPFTRRRASVSRLLRQYGAQGLLNCAWQSTATGELKNLVDTCWNVDCWEGFLRIGKVDWQMPSLNRSDYQVWFFVQSSYVDTLVEMAVRLRTPQPAVERQGWWPETGEQLSVWCRPDGLACVEARSRATAKGRGSEAQICAELFSMWQEVVSASPGAKFPQSSAKSIETLRRDFRKVTK